jgi:8-oxo-dGTP diphosphatase
VIRPKAVCIFRRGDRILVGFAEDPRTGGLYARALGGGIEFGERSHDALRREIREELGAEILPQAFLGEVPLDGVVAAGPPGASTLRVWWARLAAGEPVAREHADLRWVTADRLEALDWIPADRPLVPAVLALLTRL